MAVVRFSNALQTTILNNARSLFTKRIRESNETNLDISVYFSVRDAIFSSFQQHLNAIPQDFLCVKDKMEINCHLPDGPYFRRSAVIDCYAPSVSNRVYKHTEDDMLRFDLRTSYSDVEVRVNPDHPKNAGIVRHMRDITARSAAIQEECDNFVGGVAKIITSFTTLAPALKEWPPLWDLLPEETKDRHKQVRKTTRGNKREGLEEVDLDKLSSTVTVAKLTGGNS
jgi:hypothetical protein